MVDINKKQVKFQIELPEKAENANFCEEGQLVAFTDREMIYLSALANGITKQITSDGGNGIVNGQTVHRNEFGISGGIFNSPEGDFVAFYRKDESMVKDYPLGRFYGPRSRIHAGEISDGRNGESPRNFRRLQY